MQAKLTALLAGRRGHFQMESGYHNEQWFDLGGLLAQRECLQPFVRELAQRLAVHRIDAVCGPMSGGAALAERVAAELGCASFHTARIEPPGATGLFPVRYVVPSAQRALLRAKIVAIVDDAISAGSAVKGTYADLLVCGARPVACGALFIFGDAATQFAVEKNLHLEGIAHLPFALWKPADCPLCQAGVPVEKVSDATV